MDMSRVCDTSRKESMTKKDYILLAMALRESEAERRRAHTTYHEHRRGYTQWQRDCEFIADALARDNSRFDRATFLSVCQMDGPPPTKRQFLDAWQAGAARYPRLTPQ
jgi:hypothetical protein